MRIATGVAAGAYSRLAPRLEGILFGVLVVLHLLPFWVVANVPTTDGPSHVYNAWILERLAIPPGDPQLAPFYQIDWRPLPNWIGHATLALLLPVFSPATAEKILVSGSVVLFLLGARSLAGAVDPERRWLAFLAFPLVFNQTFQLGLFNFGFSLGFFLFAVAFWWRHRTAPGLGFALRLNGLLLLCYFSHVVSALLALFAIGVLWLVTLRAAPWRRHLLHVALLAPQAILPLWFVRSNAGGPVATGWPVSVLVRYFCRLEVLFSFSESQILLGTLLAALFLLLAVATLAGRRPLVLREEDGFLLLALLFVVIYFVSPEGMSGGTLLKNRLSLYPWLLLLPWLAPRFSPRWNRPLRTALVAVLALVAAGNVVAHVRWYRTADRDVQAFLATTGGIAPGTRVLPLLFDRKASVCVLPLLGHAFDRAATEKRLIDWSNYEAATDKFPIRFRGMPRPDLWVVEAMPEQLHPDPYRDQIDYVFCWKMPPGSSLGRRLLWRFALISEQGPARLYERRTRVRARREIHEMDVRK